MSNFFDKALTDVKQLEQELLGPDYSYWQQIYSPTEIGMSAEGTVTALENDIAGLIGYTQLLVTGGGRASKVKGPLGNKFFLETGAKCKDKATGEKVTRSLYINNVPDGSIPFISAGMGGATFTTFEGIIPGSLSNLAHINPMQIFQSFMTGTEPECQSVTLTTINTDNEKSQETKYVTTVDLGSMPACWFPNGANPVTGATCNEVFTNMNGNNGKMPDDRLVKIYYSALGLLGLYILFKLFEKKK